LFSRKSIVLYRDIREGISGERSLSFVQNPEYVEYLEFRDSRKCNARRPPEEKIEQTSGLVGPS